MNQSKGIILAGGKATRMYPATSVISKQLLPVFDKPMIYYPLSLLMLAGIREIAIIVNPEDKLFFSKLLGDGSIFGIHLTYIEQSHPAGIVEAYLLAEEFLSGSSSFLVLGDNIFVGPGLGRSLGTQSRTSGAHVFLYEVENPSEYGNVQLGNSGRIIQIVEKPTTPYSSFAIPGLYICDGSAPERARKIKPSQRGELEIIDLLSDYLSDGVLECTELVRGTAWLDTGSPGRLYSASEYVRVIQERQGTQIACLEEISIANKWISPEEARNLPARKYKSNYGSYVNKIVEKMCNEFE